MISLMVGMISGAPGAAATRFSIGAGRAVVLHRTRVRQRARKRLPGIGVDGDPDRRVRGQPATEGLNGERRIYADKRTDVAAGLVGELLQQRKSRRGQAHVRRRLRIDVDERVDVERRAAAGSGEIGLGGKDLDRWQYGRRWRHAGCGMRVAERAADACPRGGRPQAGRALRAGIFAQGAILKQTSPGDAGLNRGPLKSG